MRERKRFRKATAMVCLVSLAAGFSGYGGEIYGGDSQSDSCRDSNASG